MFNCFDQWMRYDKTKKYRKPVSVGFSPRIDLNKNQIKNLYESIAFLFRRAKTF